MLEVKAIKDGYDKTLVCPPDKSISVRAVILCSYASGESVVKNISRCDDVLSAIDCMRALGAEIELVGDTAYVTGTGGKFKSGEVYCGNSGTTARLLIGLLSGTDGKFTVKGDRSLSDRPMKRITVPLKAMGADIDGEFLPITVIGKSLRGGEFAPEVASAQIKSALLLAGLNASGRTVVTEKEATRNHTEIMLERMGVDITVNDNRIELAAGVPKAVDITIPADFSAALYPLCLALASGGRCTVKSVGLNPTRTAALKLIDPAGKHIQIDNIKTVCGEPCGDITAKDGPVNNIVMREDFPLSAVIDEYPVLCALSCFATGKSVIRLTDELRVKESDRIDGIINMLGALGASFETDGQTLTVIGAPLSFGTVDPKGDHRIAMAAAVAMAAGSGGRISGEDCTAVSYPNFFREVLGV